jgi:hypothetical protein
MSPRAPIPVCPFGHEYVTIKSPHYSKSVYYCVRCEVGYVLIRKRRTKKRKHLDRQEVMALITGSSYPIDRIA